MAEDGKTARKPNQAQNIGIGLCAGLSEVAIQQPLVAWKNALQQGRPISLRPAELYRGGAANATAVAPVTAVQFMIYGALGDKTHPLLAASLAGATSASVASPLEMVMLQQQKNRFTVGEAIRRTLRTPTRGIALTAAREACFCGGYLGLAPIFATWISPLTDSDNSLGDTPQEASATARLFGSMAAGVIAGVTSHPFDMAKTIVQSGDVYDDPATALHQLRARGVSAFFTGVFPRGLRIMGAVVIFQEVKTLLENRIR